MRVLVVTKLFPNVAAPAFAVFNRQQIGALARLCEVELLATIPWFPGARWLHSTLAARFAAVPATEVVEELLVRHPRVLQLPRVHSVVAPALYAASLLPDVRRLRGRIDVVLGSWAYPDGIAATFLARALGVPAVVAVLGSDLNVLAQRPGIRWVLRAFLPSVARLVAVSRPLAEVAAGLGVPRERIAVVENGVDRRLFFPADRSAARRELGLPAGARIILYVGRLEREKGVADLLEAFPRVATALPESVLVIVGDGGLRSRCEEAAARGGRVVCAGPRPLEDVPRWLAACDVLTLPSWNEGTPNVLLEALAAGRRVVASRVGGIPDVIRNAELGELVPPRDVPILAATLARALVAPYDPNALAAAAPHDWSQSAAALLGVLREAVGPAARA